MGTLGAEHESHREYESHRDHALRKGIVADLEGSIINIASPKDRDVEGPSEIDRAQLEATLEYIRPALQADGGDMVLLGTNGGTVNLQLVGACGGCPISETTVTAGIERIIKDRVPGVTEVVATG